MEKTTSGLSLTLDPADVQRVITETIRTQVATALCANGESLVANIVTTALGEKRDSYGHRSDREPSVLEKLLRTEVEAATKEAIKEWVHMNKAAFMKAVDTTLRTQSKSIAGALVASLVQSVDNPYLCVGITVTPRKGG